MIDEEIVKAKEGKEGYVGVKINSLTDKKIIDKLIEAGKAGVKIRMIVRGICKLNQKENRSFSISHAYGSNDRMW